MNVTQRGRRWLYNNIIRLTKKYITNVGRKNNFNGIFFKINLCIPKKIVILCPHVSLYSTLWRQLSCKKAEKNIRSQTTSELASKRNEHMNIPVNSCVHKITRIRMIISTNSCAVPWEPWERRKHAISKLRRPLIPKIAAAITIEVTLRPNARDWRQSLIKGVWLTVPCLEGLCGWSVFTHNSLTRQDKTFA